MKTCRLCQKSLDESMFYITNNGQLRTECKDCTRSIRTALHTGGMSDVPAARTTFLRAGSERFKQFAKEVEQAFCEGRFDRLNDRERRIMIYRYFHGKKASEVARLVGISETAVSVISREAVKKLWRAHESCEELCA